jgi:hypothetical protein
MSGIFFYLKYGLAYEIDMNRLKIVDIAYSNIIFPNIPEKIETIFKFANTFYIFSGKKYKYLNI